MFGKIKQQNNLEIIGSHPNAICAYLYLLASIYPSRSIYGIYLSITLKYLFLHEYVVDCLRAFDLLKYVHISIVIDKYHQHALIATAAAADVAIQNYAIVVD